MTNLTSRDDWDKVYISRDENIELNFGWRNHSNEIIVNIIEKIGLIDKNILEIGAGNSQWLPYLAQKYPNSRFSGLDYSKIGCDRLAKRMALLSAGITIDIYHQDMFIENSDIHEKFDLIMSFGVVEHFTELSNALRAKRRYMKDQGFMFTLIPNMAGLIGYLAKSFNKEVYYMHNPHDWNSFLEGHRKAGLTVISGGYLGSVNFGVLSNCFEKSGGLSWHAYVFLTRLSKAVAFIESTIGDLPSSRMFSPYIYAISRAD